MQLCFGHTSTHEIHLRFYFYSLFQLSICTYSDFYIFLICALCMQNTSANSSIQEDKIVKHFRTPQIGSFMHYYFYTTSFRLFCFSALNEPNTRSFISFRSSLRRNQAIHKDQNLSFIRLFHSIPLRLFL